MDKKVVEKYKYVMIEMEYIRTMRTPEVKEIPYCQAGQIINTTINKVVFLLNDNEEDKEVFIPYEDIKKIEPIKVL